MLYPLSYEGGACRKPGTKPRRLLLSVFCGIESTERGLEGRIFRADCGLCRSLGALEPTFPFMVFATCQAACSSGSCRRVCSSKVSPFTTRA